MGKPVIAITMGDAAGIGSELIVKVLSQAAVYEACLPFVVGDAVAMQDICQKMGAGLRFRQVQDLAEAKFEPGVIDVLCPAGAAVGHVSYGRLDPAMGKAAALCLKEAAAMATAGRIQGIVSAPLNKEAFHLASYSYADELAYLADLTGSAESFILGVMGAIWTIAVTEHIPFRDIIALVKKERILWHIAKINEALRQVGIAAPRIGVAALNVHAGEGGLYGSEEIDEIEPAIRQGRERGIQVQGPVPADMIFVRALAGDFDGVVCMYHDQANIARKLQPKSEGATIFMGLPVACGTTAHGTAFDIAGRGIADPGSLSAALKHTAALARSAS
jgi:4-hydroxythreonine-4-phosphate dehydrogenase